MDQEIARAIARRGFVALADTCEIPVAGEVRSALAIDGLTGDRWAVARVYVAPAGMARRPILAWSNLMTGSFETETLQADDC